MIVELAAPTTMLAALDPSVHPEWAGWIRRAQRRLALLGSEPDGDGADHPAGGPAGAHPASSTVEARRRRAGRELDRWIRVRDRHCLGVTCPRTVHSADLDHTRDWIDGGLTIAANLGGLCRHCHRLKHTDGWGLEQPSPGRFVWHTRAGASYAVEPRPVLQVPLEPAPRPDGRPRRVVDVEGPVESAGVWTDLRRARPRFATRVAGFRRRTASADADDVPPPSRHRSDTVPPGGSVDPVGG